MSNPNLTEDLLQFFDEEIAEIASPTCIWWGVKRSFDGGQSYQKTNRLERFQGARDALLNLVYPDEDQKSSQLGDSDGSLRPLDVDLDLDEDD